MDMNGSGSMSMPMYFNNDKPVIVVFQNWKINDAGALAGSCIGVAFIAIIYETIKRARYYFAEAYFKDSPYAKKTKVSPFNGRETLPNPKANYRRFWVMHTLNSLSFLIQVFTSYLLMLIVMTFNYWLFVSVVVGLAVGYFFASSFTINLDQDDKQEHDQCLKMSEMETVTGKVYVNEDAVNVSTHDFDGKVTPVLTTNSSSDDLKF